MAKTGNFIQVPITINDGANTVTQWCTIPEHDDPQEQQEQIRKKILILAGKHTLGES